MRINSRSEMWRRTLTVVLLCAGLVAVARADGTNCGGPPHPSSYIPQKGDVESGQQLSVERAFNGVGKLELNMCSGELRIERGHSDQLKLCIETSQHPALKMRVYLKTLDVADGHATISLEFPNDLHPVVVLELPSSVALKSEINLGAGKLYFDADGVKGERELNVGAGEAHLSVAGDHDYQSFEANVGMGSFHDHRPGGHSAHFIVSREFQGNGAGSLEVNVGAGSIDVDPAKEQTI